MLLSIIFACLLAAVTAAPYHDQRQDGQENFMGDIKNVVILFGIPKFVTEFLSGIDRSADRSGEEPIAADRSDIDVTKAFVKPSTPYQVKIGSVTETSVDAGSDAEVVIAGRRRLEIEPQPQEEEEVKLHEPKDPKAQETEVKPTGAIEPQPQKEEIKLIESTETKTEEFLS